MTTSSSTLMPSVLKDLLGEDKDIDFSLESHKELEQSDVSVIRLARPPHHRLVLKHISLSVLRKRVSKTEEKWAISARSFQNETTFYSATDVTDLARSGGVTIPKAWAVKQPPKESLSSPDLVQAGEWWLLIDLLGDNWRQRQILTSLDEAKRALKALAAFHAYFWEQSGDSSRLPPSRQSVIEAEDAAEEGRGHVKDLFPFGCWWRRYLRPSVKFERTEATYRELVANFPEAFAGQDVEKTANVLRRLSQAETLEKLEKLLRPEDLSASARRRTLVHGDAKLSNLFFSTTSTEVALIDFQWSGSARSGCGDLAYFLLNAVSGDMLASTGDELRLFYYQELCKRLWQRVDDDNDNGPREDLEWPGFTRDEFERELALEWLDYVKTAIPQLMAGIDATVAKENELKYGFLSHEFDPSMMSLMVSLTRKYAEKELFQLQ